MIDIRIDFFSMFFSSFINSDGLSKYIGLPNAKWLVFAPFVYEDVLNRL